MSRTLSAYCVSWKSPDKRLTSNPLSRPPPFLARKRLTGIGWMILLKLRKSLYIPTASVSGELHSTCKLTPLQLFNACSTSEQWKVSLPDVGIQVVHPTANLLVSQKQTKTEGRQSFLLLVREPCSAVTKMERGITLGTTRESHNSTHFLIWPANAVYAVAPSLIIDY